ncbi:MAG: penicillin acylase family protein, partial [Thermoplasmatales archaeon]
TSVPFSALPPLQKFLNPSTGVWDPQIPSYSTGVQYLNITVNGSKSSVIIYREADGFIGIDSNTTWGMYYEQGYLEAEYRLEEMDFLKRTALGTLSQVVGPSALPSDIFYRTLEDSQLAQMEAVNISPTSETYMALHSFVLGINAYINSLNPGNMPLLFKLLNYKPHDWNVTDVLAIQQLFLWQNTPATFDPLYFNYALQKMPSYVVQAIYPSYPAGIQNPIVPYSLNPSIYDEAGDIGNLSLYTPSYNYSNISSYFISRNIAPAIVNYTQVNLDDSYIFKNYIGTNGSLKLQYAPFEDMGSNDWAVSGVKTDDSSALLANDPHLTTSVPSIWIGFQLVSPGENAVGVIFPGFPGIILGHNTYVAWGATNGQVQETYFYAEKTSPAHPNMYFMNGSWVKFQIINESIPVKGEKNYNLTIERARNGVVIEDSPSPIAMDWTGLYPTYEITAVLLNDRAETVKQFAANLSEYFKVAIQNWAVADSRGNIGIFPYGEYPIIKAGDPRGILPGTGQYDWVGFIPQSEEPFLYDPARGFVFSANQITVSANYPYYIGWDYESGYRADEIYYLLNSTSGFTISKMESVQLSVHDYTTNILLEPLLRALSSHRLSGDPGYSNLSSWNGNMTINSTAATIYYFWLSNLINDTFMPYMQYYNITPADGLYKTSFFLGQDDTYHGPLIEDIINWTLTDPSIHWFDNPVTGQVRDETTVMLLAYNQTINYLESTIGPLSAKWEWGKIHQRFLSSFFGISAMSTISIPAAGDGNTINAAYGLLSDFGPSWRMVVNMSQPQDGVGIYPGGISENPLSNYYSNTFLPWNSGAYYLLIPETAPAVFFSGYSGVI